MALDRRSLLGLIGAGAATGCATAPVATASGPVAFLHGVASGDPDAHSAVFWTRVTPPAGATADVDVTLEVAADPAFSRIVRTSSGLRARADRDFTVKHDLDGQGLEPGTEYHYRFIAAGVTSPVGRVRTLPTGSVADVVLAVASCQLYPGGLFNAYEAMAGLERLDAVVHLGDYIYEYGAEADDYGMVTGARLGRLPDPPHEIVSLDDYRRRHAQYKTDPDLQAAHARAAFICVWDDHEVANDAWIGGAENHQPASEGDYAARKAAALRAYYEWMPIREAAPGGLREAIARSFQFGDLASLIMVETRLMGRTPQLSYEADLTFVAGPDGQPVPDAVAFQARRNAPARDLLDDGQRQWLGRELAASKAAGRPWQILGNQVVTARVTLPDVTTMFPPAQIGAFLASLKPDVAGLVQTSIMLARAGLPFNLDAWDGYPAGRERLYETFRRAGVQPVMLAGDSHAFWVNDLKDDRGERRAVEFGTSSISSPSPGDALAPFPLGPALTEVNDEVVFCDQSAKGFVVLTITPERLEAALHKVSTLFEKPFETRVLKRYAVSRVDGGLGPLREV